MGSLNKKVVIAFAVIILVCVTLLAFLLIKDQKPKSVYITEVTESGIETMISNMDFQKLELDTIDVTSTDYIELVRTALSKIITIHEELGIAMDGLTVIDEDQLIHEHLFDYYNRNLQIIVATTELIDIYDLINELPASDIEGISSNYEASLGLMGRIVDLSKDAENEKIIWLEAINALKANTNN